MGKGEDKTRRFLEHLQPLQGALEGFCRRWLADKSICEDVLQDAVANAFRDFHLYAEGSNFKAWIFRYLNLQVLGANRRTRRDRALPLDGDGIAEPAEEHAWELEFDTEAFEALLNEPQKVLEHCDAPLAKAIEQLSPMERSVLLLRGIGEFSYREIADIVSCPMGTVMSTLSRARKRVRHELTEYGQEHRLLKRGVPS